jgi:hypothetical protein
MMPIFMPQAPEFCGLYAYSIQGLMHGQNIDNHNYNIGLLDENRNKRELEVNKGGAELRRDRQNQNPGRSRTAAEMPILTAFYSLNYPSAQFSNPPPDAPPEPPPPNPPSPAGFYPVRNFPEYTPNVGYYPFCETGFMSIFPGQTLSGDDTPRLIRDGFVQGRMRINPAGYGGSGEGANFQGSYKFDRTPFIALPSGFITIQLDNPLNHVWDYAFTRVSKDELFLMVAGRVPRPGVGTGTMRRIQDEPLRFF